MEVFVSLLMTIAPSEVKIYRKDTHFRVTLLEGGFRRYLTRDKLGFPLCISFLEGNPRSRVPEVKLSREEGGPVVVVGYVPAWVLE